MIASPVWLLFFLFPTMEGVKVVGTETFYESEKSCNDGADALTNSLKLPENKHMCIQGILLLPKQKV